jgi:uncharacterized membrane protein YciS (DUF1049 family)
MLLCIHVFISDINIGGENMNTINLKPFQGQMNRMALQLATILIIPLLVGLFLKWCLRMVIKLPIFLLMDGD